MHNCNHTGELMMDALFNEPASSESLLLLEEIAHCQQCSAQYLSFSEALANFDQAAALALPTEEYWSNYEAKLRLNLVAPNPEKSWDFGIDKIGGLILNPVSALALAMLLAVLTIGGLSNLFRTKTATESEPVAVLNDVDRGFAKDAKRTDDNIVEIHSGSGPRNKKNPKPTKPERKEEGRPIKKPFSIFAPNPLAIEIQQPINVNSLEVAKHLERAQVLLRSFRNAEPAADAGYDLADERQRSRMLLKETMQLRRSAESTGDLVLEDALSTLEPILLDIANLPDHPSSEDVATIKDRMRKQEIVATLHIYANSLAINGTVAD